MTLEDLYRLLRSGHVQAQGVMDTLVDPLLVLDGALNVSAVNPAFLRTLGVQRDEIMGQNLNQLGEGVWNSPELRHLIAQVIPKAQAIIDYEITVDVAPHGPRAFLLSARRLVHPDQSSTSLLLTFSDVTRANQASAQKDILLAESQHRTRNLMAIVMALVSQTTAAGRTAEEFKKALQGRLAVLGAAQELEQDRDQLGGIGLQPLVERALAPFMQQVRITSDRDVRLSPTQTLPLSLVLHELSTNAAKYGGLTRPEGTVTLGWDVAAAGQASSLVLEWVEQGGPPVTRPGKLGFGSRLISWTISNDLGGTAEHHYEPGGLRVRIEVPLV